MVPAAPLVDGGDIKSLWENREEIWAVEEDVEWPLESDLWCYSFLK